MLGTCPACLATPESRCGRSGFDTKGNVVHCCDTHQVEGWGWVLVNFSVDSKGRHNAETRLFALSSLQL